MFYTISSGLYKKDWRLAILEKESTDINGALFTTISIPVVTTILQHINLYLIQSHDVYTSLRKISHEMVVSLFQQIRAEHCSRTVYVLNLEKLYCFVCLVISKITHNKTYIKLSRSRYSKSMCYVSLQCMS